jgi:hypothetical protein
MKLRTKLSVLALGAAVATGLPATDVASQGGLAGPDRELRQQPEQPADVHIRPELGDRPSGDPAGTSPVHGVRQRELPGGDQPGGSISIGFQGTWTSNDNAPSSFTVNNAACT